MKLILLVVLCEVKEFEVACFCPLPVLPFLSLPASACLSSTMTRVLFIYKISTKFIYFNFFMRIYFNSLLFNKLNSKILKLELMIFIIFLQQIINVKLLIIS